MIVSFQKYPSFSHRGYFGFNLHSSSSSFVDCSCTNYSDYYTLNSLSLFWLAESAQWIFEISACDVTSADYIIIMSRSRVIMSSSRTLCCLPSVKKQKHDFLFFVQCIINQLLDLVFVISRTIKVLVRVISQRRRLRLITPTPTIILDITKTSSNNCL